MLKVILPQTSYFGKLWKECVSCARFSQFIGGLGLVEKGLVVWGLVDGLWVDVCLLSGDILEERWMLGGDLLAGEFCS